ncbi:MULTISPECIES: response regulator [Stenotrophomonas]|uniref:response regulator n=1 Tax=Stenotrophomonas TaxID=40323 RepID=UPI0008A3B993|nr:MULTISPECIES: response regulator [Stenotrophomonas]OFU89051.1 hybrid sensor histidine kinase/response regulator [Stenotrophomonas sp. HMSC10F07]
MTTSAHHDSASSASASTPTVLLRWLTVCIFLCLIGTAGFFLLARMTEKVSLHRREMNAAAYNVQSYFNQREALLRYLNDSVITTVPTQSLLATNEARPLSLGMGTDRQKRVLLLSQRAEHTLTTLGADLLLGGDLPAGEMRWLAGPQLSGDLVRAPRNTEWSDKSADGRVYWSRGITGQELYLAQVVSPHDSHQWLVLQLNVEDAKRVIHGAGIGDYALLNASGKVFLTSKAASEDGLLWKDLNGRGQDMFGIAWLGGLPRQLVLDVAVGEDGWRLIYVVPMGQVARDLWVDLVCTGALIVLAAAGLVLLRRRVTRQLIEPAIAQHRQLRESAAFTNAVIDLAPVGIAVVRRSDQQIILSNTLVREWLGDDLHGQDWQAEWRAQVAGRAASKEFATSGDKHLQVLYASTRYQDDDVLLCVFNDITRHRQAQRALATARKAADSANQAKSAFLAMITHEIRTPLYGLLGTLELLGRTSLDPQQAEYLRTMNDSSITLRQLISDVLDVSKIESGQMNLEVAPFSPLDLAESVVRVFSDTAAGKGLKLVLCVDPALPARVSGDAERIRQVLSNLLSNAIKFTHYGSVTLRVRLIEREGDSSRLAWQVTDTGIGIAAKDQATLFEPFAQVKGTGTHRGTGLGLSISERLAHLMSGELRLVSEPGLGSSFTLTLPLPLVEAEDTSVRLLAEPAVYVRGRQRELVDSVVGWVQRWGGVSKIIGSDFIVGESRDGAVLVDIDPDQPLPWQGPQVLLMSAHSDAMRSSCSNAAVVMLSSLRAVGAAIAQAQRGSLRHEGSGLTAAVEPLSLHVLAVEDNPINRLILKEQLEVLGCRVSVANDGAAAMRLCLDESFDVVITDINMPEMDGHQLVRELRSGGHAVPVIGATANATFEERQRCLESGMQAYLAKPIEMNALRDVLVSVSQGGKK